MVLSSGENSLPKSQIHYPFSHRSTPPPFHLLHVVLLFASSLSSHHSRPFTFRFIPDQSLLSPSFTNTNSILFRRTIFLLSNPNSPSQCWLIKTGQNHAGKFILVRPFSCYPVLHLLPDFPKFINPLSDFRIVELCDEFGMQNVASSKGKVPVFYDRKGVVLPVSNWSDDFYVLTIVDGKLTLFSSVEQKWNIVSNEGSWYVDVVCFRGEFYVVDRTGKIVVVSVDSGDVVVVEPGLLLKGAWHILMSIGNDLVLVDVCASVLMISGEEDENDGEGLGFGDSNWFPFFKPDRGGRRWAKVHD